MIVRILKLNEEIGRLTLTSLEENIVISGPKKEFITELLTTGIRFKDKILTLKDKNLLMENLYIALSGDYFRATKPEKENSCTWSGSLPSSIRETIKRSFTKPCILAALSFKIWR